MTRQQLLKKSPKAITIAVTSHAEMCAHENDVLPNPEK